MDAQLELALSLLDEGRFLAAGRSLERLLREGNAAPEVLLGLAVALAEQGQDERAGRLVRLAVAELERLTLRGERWFRARVLLGEATARLHGGAKHPATRRAAQRAFC